jgi:hypothetical protein
MVRTRNHLLATLTLTGVAGVLIAATAISRRERTPLLDPTGTRSLVRRSSIWSAPWSGSSTVSTASLAERTTWKTTGSPLRGSRRRLTERAASSAATLVFRDGTMLRGVDGHSPGGISDRSSRGFLVRPTAQAAPAGRRTDTGRAGRARHTQSGGGQCARAGRTAVSARWHGWAACRCAGSGW